LDSLPAIAAANAVAPVAPPVVEPAKPVLSAVPAVAPVAAPVPVKPAAVAVAPAVKPQPQPAPKPVVKAVVKPPVPVVKPAAGSGWYAAQASNRYVVQVLGTGVEANAQAFVRQHGSEYHYFKKVLQGKPLYVVTYGSFATRAAAQASIKALPAKVQAAKPWPRTIASVRQEMK
jgi:DamX protein